MYLEGLSLFKNGEITFSEYVNLDRDYRIPELEWAELLDRAGVADAERQRAKRRAALQYAADKDFP
jgi:hypothetical protein